MEKSNIEIRLEKKEHQKVENLVRESFWDVHRPGCIFLSVQRADSWIFEWHYGRVCDTGGIFGR